MKKLIEKDVENFKKDVKRITELEKRDLKRFKKDIYGEKETDKEKDSEE